MSLLDSEGKKEMRCADYVIQFMVDQGITDVFMVSGGGIIYLVDALGKNPAMNYYCNHNEQATGYCAEGYARQKNGMAACLVTTGPGSTNAVSGAASAWVDSVPVCFISGQVKRELIADYTRLRQIGEQEINIIDMVRPVTKYAVTVTDPGRIRYELEQAFHLATTGRPGPVWINIPLDVQGAEIDPPSLPSFEPPRTVSGDKAGDLAAQVAEVLNMMKSAKRPLLLAGYGIRLSQGLEFLESVLNKIPIPVVLSFNGMDLLPEEHPNLVGKPGIIGQRRANFAVQNSDLLISIGSRMNIKIVGYGYRDFAPRAKKVMVDIDPEEMGKPTVSPDKAIVADAREFLAELSRQLDKNSITIHPKWLDTCRNWKQRYPNITNEHKRDKHFVNTYVFFDRLSAVMTREDSIVTGNGMAALNLYQGLKVLPGQRAFTNNGYGAMGWGLPAAIGTCIAHDKQRTVCVTGDGSVQMNIQELGLIGYLRLPVKLFILNNQGYTSIRLTQDNFFNGHYVGADQASGVGNPDFWKIAEAYGLKYVLIDRPEDLDEKIRQVLESDGPVLGEVSISPQQGISPKTMSFRREDGTFESRPLEDMAPFLPREELIENMRISED